jgi:hypothetical protein
VSISSDHRGRVDLPFFDQLDVARDVAHHVKATLLAGMNGAPEERQRGTGEGHGLSVNPISMVCPPARVQSHAWSTVLTFVGSGFVSTFGGCA